MISSIVKKDGDGVGNNIFFKAESHTMINTVDAQQAQMNKGYHPCGYGFYNFQCSKINDKYIATWNCSASCD